MTSVLEDRFPEIESLNEHQSLARSHKSVAKMCSPFCQPDIESKFIIIRLIPVGKYPCLIGYSYIHRVRILVVCTLKPALKFLVDSHIRKLQNRGISTKTSTSTISSKKLMPFYLEVPRPSYTCFVITSRTFGLRDRCG